MSEKKNGESINLVHWGMFLIIFTVMAMFSQAASYYKLFGVSNATTANLWLMIKGYGVLYIGTMLGLVLAKYIRIGWPAVIWVSLVFILFSLPWVPTNQFMVSVTGPAALLPMAAAILAYAGLALAREELQLFKANGWKIAIIACLAFVGSFFFSALIAQAVLKALGQI